MKQNLTLAVALVALVCSIFVVARPVQNVDLSSFSAAPGPEHTDLQLFRAGEVNGGFVVATSTNDTTATFLASDLFRSSGYTRLINFTPSVTGITATLPATSTLRGYIPNAGDSTRIALCNGTTTAATTFTFAAGTGMNLQQASSTMTVATGQCAKLELVRNSDTDIELFYDIAY